MPIDQLKNKTVVALIIILFVFGVLVGYLYNKPVKEVKLTPTPTPTPTPMPTIIPATPSPTPTVTPIITPVKDFTVKQLYDPEKDRPTKTIELANYRTYPDIVRIHPEESVLIKFTDYSLQLLILKLNSSFERKLRPGGAIYVTFHNKGSYSLEAIIPSNDPSIIPRPYAKGIIKVY